MRLMSVWSELWLRRRRHFTAIAGLAIGIALLLIVYSLAEAYKEATRLPLREIGADISIQRNGDVPEEMDGVVFPCSAVTITKDEIDAIKAMPGVWSVATSVLLWVFDAERFMLAIGVDTTNNLGPGNLKNFVIEGEYFTTGNNQALVDATFAHDEGIKVGDSLSITGRTYSVVGIVDATRTSRMVKAHVYLPLLEAQSLAVASKAIQSVSPFTADDANVVFLVADNEAMPGMTARLQELLGDKTAVSSPETFLQKLGSLFALSDTFAHVASAIVFIVTFLLVFKTVAGGIHERAREVAVLKCVGWTNGNISRQIAAETLAQCLVAGIIGTLIAIVVCWLLSFQTLNIPIPWEMNPTPHFLPGGSDAMFKTLSLPVSLSWGMALVAILIALVVGLFTCLLSLKRIARIKPSEVLRHE